MTNTCMNCDFARPTGHIEPGLTATNAPTCMLLGIPLASRHDGSSADNPGRAPLGARDLGCTMHSRLHDTAPSEDNIPLGVRQGRGCFSSRTSPTAPPGARKPEACSGCVHFINVDRMDETYGIQTPGCAARGIFIPMGQGREAARFCEHGVAGPQDPDLPGQDDLAWPYKGSITVLRPGERMPAMTAAPDPSTFDTEAEVTAADAAAGIRAWRKIADAASGKTVLMPVFDPEFFDEVERAKIPQTGDDEHPELYLDHQNLLYKIVTLWRHLGETPAVNGVPGVGKTELFRYAAWSMQLPFERFSITSSTELDDLQGRVVFEDGETRWQNGRVPTAWAKPCVIVIDEPNVGPPDVWQFLRPLTDDSKQLVLDANKGERIDRNPHCYMGMAFNPSWDMRNVGTHEISDADGSRLMHIAVQPPSEDVEREIIAARCALDGYEVPDAVMDQVMGVAKDLRALADEDAFPMHWGVRQQIKVARATQWFSIVEAYRLAAGDLLDPESADQLLVTVRSHTPAPRAELKVEQHSAFADGGASTHMSLSPSGKVTTLIPPY